MTGPAGTTRVSVARADGLPPRVVDRVVRQVLRGERRRAEISVTFLGRRRMRQLNAAHLGRDRDTDVIAFALPQSRERVAGDVYISRFAAARAAHTLGVPLREELLRLVIHGTLHVLGWNHPEGPSRMRSPMWRRQERYLRAAR